MKRTLLLFREDSRGNNNNNNKMTMKSSFMMMTKTTTCTQQPQPQPQPQQLQEEGSSSSSMMIDNTTKIMISFNVISLICYCIEWNKTGKIVTSSGLKAKGYHEIPAIIAFVSSCHQMMMTIQQPKQQEKQKQHTFSSSRKFHPIIGKIAIISTIFCLFGITQNLKSGILLEFQWEESFLSSLQSVVNNKSNINNNKDTTNPSSSLFWIIIIIIRNLFLVWNETVNIHQFFLFGPLLIYQLWKGYHSIIKFDNGKQQQQQQQNNIRRHEQHMKCAMKFLLFPLTQRFVMNHIIGRNKYEWGLICQVITYTILMIIMYTTTIVARTSIRLSSLCSFCIAIIMIYIHNTSALMYLLKMATTTFSSSG